MSKKNKGHRAAITYKTIAAEPRPFRAWLHEDWKRPGPPKAIPAGAVVRLMPDHLGDLPVWGLDWQNPPLSRGLLKLLVAWQNEFDDHGQEERPAEDWDAWVAEGKRLAVLLRRELGPSVILELDSDLKDGN